MYFFACFQSNSLSGGGFFGTAGSSWIQKLVAYLPVLTQIIKYVKTSLVERQRSR